MMSRIAKQRRRGTHLQPHILQSQLQLVEYFLLALALTLALLLLARISSTSKQRPAQRQSLFQRRRNREREVERDGGRVEWIWRKRQRVASV